MPKKRDEPPQIYLLYVNPLYNISFSIIATNKTTFFLILFQNEFLYLTRLNSNLTYG